MPESKMSNPNIAIGTDWLDFDAIKDPKAILNLQITERAKGVPELQKNTKPPNLTFFCFQKLNKASLKHSISKGSRYDLTLTSALKVI